MINIYNQKLASPTLKFCSEWTEMRLNKYCSVYKINCSMSSHIRIVITAVSKHCCCIVLQPVFCRRFTASDSKLDDVHVFTGISENLILDVLMNLNMKSPHRLPSSLKLRLYLVRRIKLKDIYGIKSP